MSKQETTPKALPSDDLDKGYPVFTHDRCREIHERRIKELEAQVERQKYHADVWHRSWEQACDKLKIATEALEEMQEYINQRDLGYEVLRDALARLTPNNPSSNRTPESAP